MPFALAIIGILFMVTAIKGTTSSFFSLVASDFQGSGNYVYWVVSILVIGSIGYVKRLQPISDMFLALVLIVLFLQNKGFFAQFTSAIQSGSGNCTIGQNASDAANTAALAATAAAPGSGFGFTDNYGANNNAAPSTQLIPDPLALGPL